MAEKLKIIPLGGLNEIGKNMPQEEAESYCPPDWFGEDVTFSVRYHNSTLSRGLTEK